MFEILIGLIVIAFVVTVIASLAAWVEQVGRKTRLRNVRYWSPLEMRIYLLSIPAKISCAALIVALSYLLGSIFTQEVLGL